MFENRKRLMSYIYLYSGDVRSKNAGFAKAELSNDKLVINITLRGVYTDAAEEYSIRFLVDGNSENPGAYTLIFVGKCTVSRGLGSFTGEYDCENIADTGYALSDISGLALIPANAKYSSLFSMWDDCEIKPELAIVAGEDYKKSVENNEDVEVEATEAEDSADTFENAVEYEEQAEEVETENDDTRQAETALDLSAVEVDGIEESIEKLFKDREHVDAFADDILYDCVEVMPEQLKSLPVKDSAIVNNSFILHGFYNFRHVLLGRVEPNSNNTSYFIGVPGMYCNRERFMASMFGFNNFKKSHRSDITNPYFGYWYQEF